MGHHTTFQADIRKGIERSRLLAEAFNRLSVEKHGGAITAFLNRAKRHNGSEIVIRNVETGNFRLVDPRPRQSMRHHKIGRHMIYCRNSKMVRRERIGWAVDRIIWIVVMDDGIPESYNVVAVRELMRIGQIGFDRMRSNPTALRLSIRGYMPTIPWKGGFDGFGLVRHEDAVEAFRRMIDEC